VFELWDAELGMSLGAFESESEALAAVRRLCAQSAGSRAPLGLVQDGRTVLATGDALVERAEQGGAQSRLTPNIGLFSG
jgi:hypothetical protein